MNTGQRPPIHVLLYGETGTWKSSFAKTFPKPLLVICFDPHGKDMPYWKGAANVSDLKTYQIGQTEILYREVMQSDGPIRIEYFHNFDLGNPSAYPRFLTRIAQFAQEYQQWKTLVTDSVTFMALSARKYNEKVLNPIPEMERYKKGTGHDTRQWFGAETDALEEMLVIRYAGLPMNIVTICHASIEMSQLSGEMIKGPAVRGRLRKENVLLASHQEQYHTYPYKDEAGKEKVALQTKSGGGFAAATQIEAPNPCWPSYESLWENWRK